MSDRNSNLILGWDAAAREFGRTRSTLKRWVQEGRFPPPMKTGPAQNAHVFWTRQEIEDAKAQMRARGRRLVEVKEAAQ